MKLLPWLLLARNSRGLHSNKYHL